MDYAEIAVPRNPEIETALIAAILTEPKAFHDASTIVQAEHFYEPLYQRLYAACAAIIDRGERPSAKRLMSYFGSDKDLQENGGVSFLQDIQDSVVTTGQARQYALDLRLLWQRRRLIDAGLAMVENAQDFDVEGDINTEIAAAEHTLYQIAASADEATTSTAHQAAYSTLDEVEQNARTHEAGGVVGIPTGLEDLDDKIGGLKKGAFYVLAGGTAQGKSALAGTIADHVCDLGMTVIFISLEMLRGEVTMRIFGRRTGVSVSKMERGTVTLEERRAIAEAAQAVQGWSLLIADKPGLSMPEIRGIARRAKIVGPVHLVVVDYLQLVNPPPSARYENRTNEVAKISRGLKALAMEIGAPVLALSQLSRAVDRRDDNDKRPRLSDLRESGTIEQDADVVLFVYREEDYLLRNPPADNATEDEIANYNSRLERVRGLAEIIIGKQRSGFTGRCPVRFNGERMRFEDLAGAADDQQPDIAGLMD